MAVAFQVRHEFSEPVCLEPGGSTVGAITFRVENLGPVELHGLSMVDTRAISTSGETLFLRFVVCPVQPGVCEFRPDSPQTEASCAFSLARGESYTCSISQTVGSNTRSFGDNAVLSGADACDQPFQASSTVVTHVTTNCPQ